MEDSGVDVFQPKSCFNIFRPGRESPDLVFRFGGAQRTDEPVGGVAWRATARRAPDVPLHIRLGERMHESRLDWVNFLHEHTQQRGRNKGAGERNGARMMKRNTPRQDKRCRVRAEAERADHRARGEYAAP